LAQGKKNFQAVATTVDGDIIEIQVFKTRAQAERFIEGWGFSTSGGVGGYVQDLSKLDEYGDEISS
jgi:hypothetical protein